MRSSLLDLLCCPACRGADLALSVLTREADEIIEGTLRCSRCNETYWIVAGVPRMLGRHLFTPPAHLVARAQAAAANDTSAPADDMADLKKHTIQNFGHQWLEWNRFGWGPEGPEPLERELFDFKSLLTPDDLRSKVVIDAGCGNGRYAYFAAQHARHVIAIDLGPAVDSAYANLRAFPNVHVVQGDLFNVPVRNGAVDVIFSIGVLMHTGNARRATEHLASLLGPGGSLTVHVYHKGNRVYEFNDRLLRAVTTRLSIPTLHQVAAGMTKLGAFLKQRGLLGYANGVIWLDDNDTTNFDWYAAPIATHHTYPEVFGWIEDLGMTVVADNRASSLAARPAPTLRKKLGRLFYRDWALTVRAVKPPASAHQPIPSSQQKVAR